MREWLSLLGLVRRAKTTKRCKRRTKQNWWRPHPRSFRSNNAFCVLKMQYDIWSSYKHVRWDKINKWESMWTDKIHTIQRRKCIDRMKKIEWRSRRWRCERSTLKSRRRRTHNTTQFNLYRVGSMESQRIQIYRITVNWLLKCQRANERTMDDVLKCGYRIHDFYSSASFASSRYYYMSYAIMLAYESVFTLNASKHTHA